MSKTDPRRELRTRRLVIRPLTLGDYRAWCRSQDLADPKRDEFDAHPSPPELRSYDVFRQNVMRQRREAKMDAGYIWTMFLKGSHELVGHLDVTTIARAPYQMANLGYYVINTYRGKGYAREALREVIPVAFKDLTFHRLEAVIDLDNRASIAVAKSAGLYREGIKKHYRHQNGHWVDQVVFIAIPELFK